MADAIKGFSNSKRIRRYGNTEQYATLQKDHNDKVSQDTIIRGFAVIETIASVSIVDNIVELTATTAMPGYMLQHVLSGDEYHISEVNGDFVSCMNDVPVAYNGGNFVVKKAISQLYDLTGSQVVTSTPGPAQFREDGVAVEVIEDNLLPVNNNALPNRVFVDIDGVQTQLHKDTAVRANSVDLPVNDYDLNTVTGTQADAAIIDPATDGSIVSYMRGKLTQLNAMLLRLPVLLGSQADTLSLGVALSTEDRALLAPIATQAILASVYWNAAVDGAIPVAGVIVGSIAAAGKTIQMSNNANAMALDVNGVQVATSLPGAPLKYEVDMAIGNVTLRSLVGADITAGDVSINIMG